uniref:Radical S-adenosyl methionine domain-containing protein 1, mitochondrial n=1 Tax=Chromera velia CCMP2878 TaxID=1169474 RepID=A0A0G4F281_9ALVE|eukprot:Cvel_14835.t1-p1 / transcript=Cvel_14835.t1 / gene=Cvel_14835 / organism=Chromera_velia_CCMP2878 / gene_product=Oxygen-independent coproporphyrinogen-III, putative / transcript_product=Oxygen-independent coproporphyrinogen-III, putative / location=Cvel_scaffold1071:30449-36241(-) / protein_length=834 / sequence_SO=supercontig / SO=protein_coding / is_pseudo=false
MRTSRRLLTCRRAHGAYPNRRRCARVAERPFASAQLPPAYIWPRAVYVHLPFCRRRCFYCSFSIKVVGDGQKAQETASEEYCSLLRREIRATGSLLRQHGDTRLTPESELPSVAADCFWQPSLVRASSSSSLTAGPHPLGLASVYFGGGTPSLTPPWLIEELMREIEEVFGKVRPEAEVTMEMDPGTFDRSKLSAYLSAGINRVSLGIQSFDSEVLRKAGRAHSVEDGCRALETLRKAGVENFSLDLISGLPGLTMEVWRDTLKKTVEANPAHVSVYDLQVEPDDGSIFGRRGFRQGKAPLPLEDEAAEMYTEARNVLTAAGYDHYEISNFGRKKMETGEQTQQGKSQRGSLSLRTPFSHSLHNRCYWEGAQFLGFGMGAASFLGGHRHSRPGSLGGYKQWVSDLETAAGGTGMGQEITAVGKTTGRLDREGTRETGSEVEDEMAARSSSSSSVSASSAEKCLDRLFGVSLRGKREGSESERLCEGVMLAMRRRQGLCLRKVMRLFGASGVRGVLRGENVMRDVLGGNLEVVLKFASASWGGSGSSFRREREVLLSSSAWGECRVVEIGSGSCRTNSVGDLDGGGVLSTLAVEDSPESEVDFEISSGLRGEGGTRAEKKSIENPLEVCLSSLIHSISLSSLDASRSEELTSGGGATLSDHVNREGAQEEVDVDVEGEKERRARLLLSLVEELVVRAGSLVAQSGSIQRGRDLPSYVVREGPIGRTSEIAGVEMTKESERGRGDVIEFWGEMEEPTTRVGLAVEVPESGQFEEEAVLREQKEERAARMEVLQFPFLSADLRLTDPKGMLLENDVVSSLFRSVEDHFLPRSSAVVN